MATSRRQPADSFDALASALRAAVHDEVVTAVTEVLERTPTESVSLLDVPAVCARLALSPAMVKRLIAAGTLPSVLVGRRRLVPSSAVAGYIASLQSEQLRLF